jgi:hypothetical protein
MVHNIQDEVLNENEYKKVGGRARGKGTLRARRAKKLRQQP